jgi:hypothetical protein
MSYFPGMFKAGGKTRTYMVQVNSLGDCVVYSLDAEGKPAEFVCGETVNVVSNSLLADFPDVKLVDLRRHHNNHKPPTLPQHFRLDFYGTWAELAVILNGKPGTRQARLRGQWCMLMWLGINTGLSWGDGEFASVNEAGKKADAEIVRKRQEAETKKDHKQRWATASEAAKEEARLAEERAADKIARGLHPMAIEKHGEPNS